MIVTKNISLKTRGDGDIIDITSQVEKHVVEAGVENGTVTVFVAGSTAGVTTIEYESGLLSDFKDMFEKLVPENIPYHHNARWSDGNGHAHVRASLLGASLVVPFSNGKLALGTWQQLVLVDFDNRARTRQVVLQIMGE